MKNADDFTYLGGPKNNRNLNVVRELKEQRVLVKFRFLFGKSAAETVLMLQEAFKEEALNKTQVYEWYSRFRGGEMSCDEQPSSGRIQPAEMMKILKKFATQSTQVVIGPLMRFLE